MLKLALLVVFIMAAPTSSFADDDTHWRFFVPSKTTVADTILIFGPPGTVKTDQPYAEWVKDQASRCSQRSVYALSYDGYVGDLKILKGPLGKASSVDVVIDAGKVIEVVWTYQGIEQEAALRQWISHTQLSKLGGVKPAVVMIGKWKPDPKTVMFATCYTGGDGAKCRGDISVRYGEDPQK